MSTTKDGHSNDSSTAGERRDKEAPRMQYEALVEVGARSVGGFEAESIDVSLDGIRLRTAYLPQPGEKLCCRFDGFGGEIIAEGEVAWCRDEGRGGEFGVRFTSLDARAMILLEKMCAPPAQPEPSDPDAAIPGTRVRLHIQGLGSPMRARIRDVARGEMLVGSNLEFLRVGRDVELEDLDQGRKRVAQIEHVGVDIDPETNIPQLVVALGFGDGADEPAVAPSDDDLTTAPYRVRNVAAPREEIAAESTPQPTVIDHEEHGPAVTPGRMAHVEMRPAQPASAPAPETEYEALDEELDPSAPPAHARAVASMGKLARKLGPKIASAGAGLASAGAGAKGALGKMLETVQRKREERAKAKAAKAPKRTTAPPPSGALRSHGKRLVRVPGDDLPPEGIDAPPKTDRKRTAFGIVLGMMAVLAIYFVSSRLTAGGEASPDDAAVAAAETAAESQEPAAEPAAPVAPQGGGIATANVPLFGATPLSTTEPVPVPPNLAGDAADKTDKTDKKEKKKKVASDVQKEWGFGELHNPVSLRLKMDGKLQGVRGTETSTGFTLLIPGRKSISSAAGLARKDKRIDSVNVVNYPDHAEVSVRFKGEVPAFVAKAKGKRLVIEISSENKGEKRKKASSAKKKKKKKKAAKKKKKK